MLINFTVDRGNTVSKLALWCDGVLERSTLEEDFCIDTIKRFLGNDFARLSGVAHCSVAMPQDITWLKSMAPTFIDLTAATPLPLTLDYSTPLTLGADRIAGAVGAWTLMPDSDILVVDAGTAVTYDLISHGCYLGGNIAPGLKMRLDSLHRFTKRLPQVEVPESFTCEAIPGKSTADAMIRGAIHGIVAETAYYRSRLPAGTRVVMTGGDAPLLASLMTDEITVDDMLVSKGLNRILEYNEN